MIQSSEPQITKRLRRHLIFIVEPLAQLIQSDFLVAGQHSGIPQSSCGVEEAHRHVRRGVNLRNHKSQIHGSLPHEPNRPLAFPD